MTTPHHQHITRLLTILRAGQADPKLQPQIADVIENLWRKLGAKA